MMARKEVLALMGLVLAAPGLEASVKVVKMSDIRVSGAPEEEGTVPLGEILNSMESQLHGLSLDQKQVLKAVSGLKKAVGEELPKLKAELQEQKTENEQRFLTLNQKIDELKAKLDTNNLLVTKILECLGAKVTYPSSKK